MHALLILKYQVLFRHSTVAVFPAIKFIKQMPLKTGFQSCPNQSFATDVIVAMLDDHQQTNCDKLYCSCHPAWLPESLSFESQGNGCKPPIDYWLSIHGNAMIINTIKTSQWVIIDFYWLVKLINIHQLIIFYIYIFFLISSSSYWLQSMIDFHWYTDWYHRENC